MEASLHDNWAKSATLWDAAESSGKHVPEASGMIHKSEVGEVNKGSAELWLYKADSLEMLTHSVGASSAVSLLSALTFNAVYVCGVAAGGNEQSAEDHLARRRDRETTGLPDVHSIKGRAPSLCCLNVTLVSTHIELIYARWTARWRFVSQRGGKLICIHEGRSDVFALTFISPNLS